MKARIFFIVSVALLLVSVLGFSSAVFAQAKGYPNQPIQIVVPFRPGGANDIFYRTLADGLTKILKVQVNILNPSGGGGAVGTSQVVNAKNDGYTLLGTDTSPLTFVTATNSKVPYDVVRDLEPIAFIAHQPKLLSVLADSEFKTLENLVDFAKKKPGDLTCGTAGLGSDSYFALEQFKNAAKINIAHMPFGGGGEVISNFLGGHINIYVGSPPVVKSYIKAGKVRGLALSGARLPDFTGVPTFAEKGYPQVEVKMEFFLLGPKGLPAEIINVWKNTLKEVLEKTEVATALKRLDYIIDLKTDSQSLRNYLRDDIEKYTKLATQLGIRQ